MQFWTANHNAIVEALVPHIPAIRAGLADQVSGPILASWTQDVASAWKIYEYSSLHSKFNPAFRTALQTTLCKQGLGWTIGIGPQPSVAASIPAASPAAVAAIDSDVVDMDEKEEMPEFLLFSGANGQMTQVKTNKPIESLEKGQVAVKNAAKLPRFQGTKCGLYMRMTSAKDQDDEVQLDTRAEVVGIDDDEEEEDKPAPQIVAKSTAGGKAAKSKTVVVDGVEITLRSGETLPTYQVVSRVSDYKVISAVVPKEPLENYEEACELLVMMATHQPKSDFGIYHLISNNRTKESNVTLKSHATIAKPSAKTAK